METVYEPTDEEREQLGRAHGEVVEGGELVSRLREEDRRVICVGDRVSLDVASSDVEAETYIVDGKIQREPVNGGKNIEAGRRFRTVNPAGRITENAWDTVRKSMAVECTSVVDVDGEEDLLALPATVFAPEDSVIVYGLRNEGAVLMDADENREFVEDILDLERSGKAIVGGSWRYMHAGHRYLVLKAFEEAEKVDIGVTSDRMLEQKLGRKPAESMKERARNVKSFLDDHGLSDRARIIRIDDRYGNAVEEGDVIVVTPETRPNAEAINDKRDDTGKDLLDIVEIDRLEARDGGYISSTRIEAGEIDVNGLRT